MTTPDGQAVPVKFVPKYDQQRDKAARKLLDKWLAQRLALEKLMSDTLAEIEAMKAARPGAPAEKGNFQFTSFDGNIEISVSQSYRIFLDDRVETARKIMRDWATGLVADFSGTEKQVVLALLEEAFRATAGGALPAGKILSLLRYDFPSDEWKQAKELLNAALKPARGKQYVSVKTRASRQHKWEGVHLDVADCWPEPGEAGAEEAAQNGAEGTEAI
jgi:Protein of unknown function (DUF3164).